MLPLGLVPGDAGPNGNAAQCALDHGALRLGSLSHAGPFSPSCVAPARRDAAVTLSRRWQWRASQGRPLAVAGFAGAATGQQRQLAAPRAC